MQINGITDKYIGYFYYIWTIVKIIIHLLITLLFFKGYIITFVFVIKKILVFNLIFFFSFIESLLFLIKFTTHFIKQNLSIKCIFYFSGRIFDV